METAEGLPGSCSGKPRGKPCPGTFHVIRSTQKSSPRVADSMGVSPAAQGTAVTGCAHQRKHRWATEQEGPTHPQQCLPQPCTRAPVEHSPSPFQEGGGNRGQGCWKGAQAAAVLQQPCCHNSHPTAGSAPAACPLQGMGTAGTLSHRKSQLLLARGSPGSILGYKGCISSPRLELKSLLGNSGPADTTVLFLPSVSPVQSPKGWGGAWQQWWHSRKPGALLQTTKATGCMAEHPRVRGRQSRDELCGSTEQIHPHSQCRKQLWLLSTILHFWWKHRCLGVKRFTQ